MYLGYNSPYSAMYDPIIRKMFRPRKQVQHQQTCPECGRKLVSLYPILVTEVREQNGVKDEVTKKVWKCKKCIDRLTEGMDEVHE